MEYANNRKLLASNLRDQELLSFVADIEMVLIIPTYTLP